VTGAYLGWEDDAASAAAGAAPDVQVEATPQPEQPATAGV